MKKLKLFILSLCIICTVSLYDTKISGASPENEVSATPAANSKSTSYDITAANEAGDLDELLIEKWNRKKNKITAPDTFDTTSLDQPKKYLALTFDDGPHKTNTPMLLDALKELDAKVTFFLLGHRIDSMRDIVKRMHDEGHAIGNHTFNHKQLPLLSSSDIVDQIAMTNDILREITGAETLMLRPPYGDRNSTVIDITSSLNMSIIIWSVDPEDWRIFDAETVSQHIIENARDGDIILLHDLYKSSAEGAILAIKQLMEEGYVFVTVPELLSLKSGGMVSGSIYRDGNGTVEK